MEHAARRIIAGLIAAGAALAAGQLTAAAIAPGSAPYFAVGNMVVDHTPAAVREWVIGAFGTSDKVFLFACLGAVIALLAVVAAFIEHGSMLIAALGLVGAIAAATRPTAGWSWIWPSVLAAVVGVLALRVLIGRSNDEDASDRRKFFSAAGILAVASAGTYWLGSRWSKGAVVAEERREATLPAPVVPAPPLPVGIDVKGAVPYITDNADFYRIDTALQVPQLTTAEWQLNIHGMVDRPRTLTWAQLTAMAATERAVTLTCVSNEIGGDLIGNAMWTGFPIKTILESVGVHGDADMLMSKSADGWTAGTPLDVLTDGRDAILAIAMNGTPLPVEHGYPVRQVVPGLYGYVSATKWVVDWELTRFDRARAYWTVRGWSARGPIKTGCRIDTPRAGGRLGTDTQIIAGTAWAQHRGITKVEVRIDQGPWQEARLAPEYSIDTWRQWWFPWESTPGEHVVTARATDGSGAVQTEESAPPAPDGATGWPSTLIRVGG
ncbi:molybdopterin-dependent oxidoreductase [Mycobacterium sp. CBMA271]|uniref:molybdopterin-dependent oxidoreductase n=1 Tax=unclassified Mycobacteroides TaxID=2618759 RepID=UPI0012DFD6B2|nr:MULTISPECIES: molybdopterin-dependent oxidoreductase [unclassified Mycobacteroides]MUM19055.1 oxidoreductase [Mycobacteroides sp. CBMA 326]MUM21468.1 molybdopterin-dependent oxidoreductase [Mycobacteroides sp. CBMA 271]